MKIKELASRNVFFVAAVILLCYWSFAYALDVRDAAKEIPSSSDGNVYVDGTDFTAVTDLFMFAASSVIKGVLLKITAVINFVLDFIAFLILFLCKVPKKRPKRAQKEDLTFCLGLLGIMNTVSYVLAVILSGLNFALPFLALYWQTPLLALLLYILPLKKRIWE